MKNIEPNGNDEALSKVLRDWKVTTPLPPRFQEQVWQRIARAEATATAPIWAACLQWIELAFSRRALAASYLVLLLMAGVSAGYLGSRQKTAELEDALGRRYVQMVDPFQHDR